MTLFRKEKRNKFHRDLKNIDFKNNVKVYENNFDTKKVLEQIKIETGKISKAIENWKDNKIHKEQDGFGSYLKSKSQKYLNEIKNACEEIEKIRNSEGITIDRLLKLILDLQSELINAATAKFSLFTFGAVLDNRKNKKRLAEISKDIGELHKKILNAKEKLEEKKAKKIVIGSHRKPKDDEKKDPKKDPGIFKGLPNDKYYCYLNTALQNLYHNSHFRRNVLNYNTNNDEMKDVEAKINSSNDDLIKSVRKLMPAEIDQDYKSEERMGGDNIETEQKRSAYRAMLYATKFFFEYLSNKINDNDNEFNQNRKKMASFLGYDGEQRNSNIIQQKIEKACTYVMNKKQRSEKIYNNRPDDSKLKDIKSEEWKKYTDNNTLSGHLSNNELYLRQLYDEDENRRKALLKLQDDDFYLKDHEKIKTIKTIFKMFEDNKFNRNKETFKLLKSLGTGQTLDGLRKTILQGIKEIAYSKEPKLLTRDSNITLNANDIKKDLVSCIEHAINAKRKQGQNAPKYRLPLKDNKFEVTFADRIGGTRSGFTAEEKIDLAKLVNNNKLAIFSGGKELDKNKTKFKLVSATIGTGGHYYLYVKKGDKWHCLNDSTHKENVSWKNIQKDINTMCETLTYKLI